MARKTFRVPKYHALRSCCNYDLITPQLNAQIDRLLAERDELLRTCKALLPNFSFRPQAGHSDRVIQAARLIVSKAERRYVLTGGELARRLLLSFAVGVGIATFCFVLFH